MDKYEAMAEEANDKREEAIASALRRNPGISREEAEEIAKEEAYASEP